MQVSLNRLFIMACIGCLPLAIIGRMKMKDSPDVAIKYYQAAVMILAVFLFFLTLYVYVRGGNFLKPIGTFY